MTNKTIILPYSEAKPLIKEADVLLFRAGPFPSIGWCIVKYTRGIHSHVALAHHDEDEIYCVEQREFKGGRSVILDSQVKLMPNTIDVYRPISKMVIPSLDGDKELELTPEIAKRITKTARGLTGSEYGWKNIWEIFKGYAPGLRMFYRDKNGDETVSHAYVCSTLVTYSYRIHYFDPCPNLNDKRTTPADIAQSSLFNYMFTIGVYDARKS